MREADSESERFAQLLTAVSGGDRHAFAQLYVSCSSSLFGLLLHILQRRDWAEEVLQDCFLQVWQQSEIYEPSRGGPLIWLSTIARYRALDLLHKRRLVEGGHKKVDESPTTVADSGQKRMNCDVGVIGRLPDWMLSLQHEQRRSLLLTYCQAYTHKELAQAMDAPVSAVKGWVRGSLVLIWNRLATNDRIQKIDVPKLSRD